MKQYLELLADVRHAGVDKMDRTGTGTRSVFGRQMRFNLADGFPLLTTKRVYFKGVAIELLWFLSGDTNIKYLIDNDVHIWDEWADENGDLGRVYGSQWRSWQGDVSNVEVTVPSLCEWLKYSIANIFYKIGLNPILPIKPAITYDVTRYTIDQIQNVMSSLWNDPDSRRHLVIAWNPAEVNDMALPPCHSLFQFYTEPMSIEERMSWYRSLPGGTTADIDETTASSFFDLIGVPSRKLSCQLYQRSADIFLGVPFNIASYSLLTMMMAHQLGFGYGEFVWTGGDVHLYSNHFEQADLQLGRTPSDLPMLTFARRPASIFEYKYDDFILANYQPQAGIKAPVAV